MTTRHEIKIVDAKPLPPGSLAQEGMPITMLVGTDSRLASGSHSQDWCALFHAIGLAWSSRFRVTEGKLP